MTLRGDVQNGVVVLDDAPAPPEGTAVRIEVIGSTPEANGPGSPRQGGQYAGRIWMAPDFDEWPEDLQEALGMKP
jgi:hypothetical protein